MESKIRHCTYRFLLVLGMMLMILSSVTVSFASEEQRDQTSPQVVRPSVNGRLHVEGKNLVDGSGTAVQLHGISTHGLTWFPDFINTPLFKQLSEEWDCNLFRLAMYSRVYCSSPTEKEECLKLLHMGLEAAIEADAYVIVDWHILEDSNPNDNREAAAEFFEMISSEFADCPNVIYEICNEPNGRTTWSDIVSYSEEIIPIIRKNSPDAVILVGTPNYDRALGDAVLNPLDFENLMYVLHFYASSDREGFLKELDNAGKEDLPVFVSECSFCEASGDGEIDYDSTRTWFHYLNDHGISYTIWNLSNKAEASAFFIPGFDPSGSIKDSDLTITGQWARALLMGSDPDDLPMSENVPEYTRRLQLYSWITNSLGDRKYYAVSQWLYFAAVAAGFVSVAFAVVALYLKKSKAGSNTYDTAKDGNSSGGEKSVKKRDYRKIILLISSWITLIYLGWRIVFSIPTDAGVLPSICSLVLLVVEILGSLESLSLCMNLFGMRDHPLPEIPEEAYPEVDVFIATYNEPVDLLRRTVNGCRHMKYPDPAKVHIWICDDNRRETMRALADEMKVGYFDRPDNKGAKAGNLNHAMSLTTAPYIVTFDADMIPKSDFLLKTIPYFVDLELQNQSLPEEKQSHLGFLQTPQSFYQPDIYQYALYSERRVPNEQDFFYRTIEPSRTFTNSVIYGGSNTVLSRRALEDAGGFYTGSITEDFATGILIQEQGYVTLAIPEPLASGQTPQSFSEHVKQRSRWGRGVIVTIRKLKLWKQKSLTLPQKISYWSSSVYWYSPIKNMVYVLSPLMFAIFGIPVFHCNWLELLVFWLPMFVIQDVNLRTNSKGRISMKWTGVYETSMMPHLFFPILKEFFGITMTSFLVTDKSGAKVKRGERMKYMRPFLVLILACVAGLIRMAAVFNPQQIISFLILLLWVLRNLYFLILSVCLVDGREGDGEIVRVYDAEEVIIESEEKKGYRKYEGITTMLTEHNITVFLDSEEKPSVGERVRASIRTNDYNVSLQGVVTSVRESQDKLKSTQTIEILELEGNEYEYLEVLYDRIPTLPQNLNKDSGIFWHLWQNIARRIGRTAQG